MKVPKAFLLSSSLVFAHEEETLDTWEVGISFLIRIITYYTNTLIHQVIIEDVRKMAILASQTFELIKGIWDSQPILSTISMNILRTFFYSTG